MKFNGENYQLEKSIILSEFLKNKGYDFLKIAVEVNYEIIPKADYEKTELHNDDIVEVVSFVGGG